MKTIKFRGHEAVVQIQSPTEHIQRSWCNGVFYEAHVNGLLDHIYDEFGPGHRYLDVGASIGNHTAFFLAIMKAKHVIAVEPFRPSFEQLKENASYNGEEFVQYELHQCIAASHPGFAHVKRMPLGEATNNIGMVSLAPEGQPVLAMTLDAIVSGRQVDVVKVDVEGMTLDVLRGAREILWHQSAYWYIECDQGDPLVDLDLFMKEFQYERTPGVMLNKTPTWEYQKSS